MGRKLGEINSGVDSAKSFKFGVGVGGSPGGNSNVNRDSWDQGKRQALKRESATLAWMNRHCLGTSRLAFTGISRSVPSPQSTSAAQQSFGSARSARRMMPRPGEKNPGNRSRFGQYSSFISRREHGAYLHAECFRVGRKRLTESREGCPS